ncbi:hypothetical protein EMCG_02153 [[Emmonsia] crescens]|uniref:Uncharacterized protein n=1 Tax=[Emmonsia] crescens TaxID=73230 RepID=A0A0G2HZJ5_9EURO|nr:hypothetical protein EMCG_02153 [Emmonsia crescens UAMH 3008]
MQSIHNSMFLPSNFQRGAEISDDITRQSTPSILAIGIETGGFWARYSKYVRRSRMFVRKIESKTQQVVGRSVGGSRVVLPDADVSGISYAV